MSAAILVVFLLAVALAVAAALLLLKASAAARSSETNLRMRVLGDDLAAEALVAKREDSRNPLVKLIGNFFSRAGIELSSEAIGRSLVIALAVVPLMVIVLGLPGGMLAIGITLAFIYGVLNRNAARRRAQIVEQLPGFLESVIRVLAAGNTLEESLAAAARESPDPIRPLFTSIGRQVRLGAPVETVLAEAGEVHRLRDLKVIALAAAINRKYGGSLRHVMKSLITNIRQRDVAARELRALTAETRFSAMVLALIPVSLSLYIFSRNRDYYLTMWNDHGGRMLLIVSIVMQVTGVFILFRMMNATEDPDA